MFNDFIQNLIAFSEENDFLQASQKIEHYILNINKQDFIEVLKQIGVIPESIPHDSTEEKLFSKASDAILSRAFRELGLCSNVLSERADSADVIAKSHYHNYQLVADAKAFRMSRTAKNQKDFKVTALSAWRKDLDYAVLTAPYFQYPSKQSQIYAQALSENVCLFSWEHILFLIENDVKEDNNINLSELWSFSQQYSNKCIVSEMKKCFIPKFDEKLLNLISKSKNNLDTYLSKYIYLLRKRGEIEKSYWLSKEESIRNYSRGEAISELLISYKIENKIIQINKYIGSLSIYD